MTDSSAGTQFNTSYTGLPCVSQVRQRSPTSLHPFICSPPPPPPSQSLSVCATGWPPVLKHTRARCDVQPTPKNRNCQVVIDLRCYSESSFSFFCVCVCVCHQLDMSQWGCFLWILIIFVLIISAGVLSAMLWKILMNNYLWRIPINLLHDD